MWGIVRRITAPVTESWTTDHPQCRCLNCLFFFTASSHLVRFLSSSHPTQTMEENCYGLRNCRRNDHEVEEGSDDEDQEPENGGNDYDNDKEEEEEGRPPQRQHVNEEHVENQDNDWENESLEEPVVLNFDEGGERNQERANQNRGAAADNQGREGEGLGRGARQSDADAAVNQGRGERGLGRGAR